MLTYCEDEKASKELVPGSKTMQERRIDERLLNKGLVAMYNGDLYMFLFGTNCWSNMTSAQAQIQLCSLVGIQNVSTNYLRASEPYIEYLETHAPNLGTIPVSMCVGTRRLEVRQTPTGLALNEALNISPVVEGHSIDESVSSFNLMPCKHRILPLSWDRVETTKIEAFLEPLFVDRRELETLLWILGGILLDPMVQAKFVVLFGPGGTGKSTILSLIDSMMKGCTGVISSGVFTGTASDIPVTALTQATSKRVAVTGELDVAGKKLNLHAIKGLTGGDKVQIPPVRVATKCTIVAAANDLPGVAEEPEWYTSQIARRVIVLPFSVNATEIPYAEMPTNPIDILDFSMKCVDVRIRNMEMPISTRALLISLLGDSYTIIKDRIRDNELANDQQVMDANYRIEMALGLEQGSLGKMASYVTTSRVTTIFGYRYVSGIEPLDGYF
jgi:energy-coupling factor transporter ATP-binding protein EcfA2